MTNIIRAINDPAVFGRYFRAESWTAWRVFLAALFGLPLVYDQKLLFERYTGRKVAPSSPLQEAWLVVGRRGGKSFVLAVIAVFLACFRDWKPYLGPGEVGTIMIIAKDRAQARHIKRFVSGVLRDTPMLAPMIEDETAEEIRLKNRVAIEIHTASFRSTRGYTMSRRCSMRLHSGNPTRLRPTPMSKLSMRSSPAWLPSPAPCSYAQARRTAVMACCGRHTRSTSARTTIRCWCGKRPRGR